MRHTQAAMEEFRKELKALCPEERLDVEDLETFCGPSLESSHAALICRLRVGSAMPPPAEVARRLHSTFPDMAPVFTETPASLGPATIGDWIARLCAALVDSTLDLHFPSGANAGDGGEVSVTVNFLIENAARGALKVAILAVAAAINTDGPPLQSKDRRILLFRQRWNSRRVSPETRLMIEAAQVEGIPVLPVAGTANVWQFGWGRRSEHFWVTSSNRDGMLALQFSISKENAKRLMEELGLPTPRWVTLLPKDDPLKAARRIGFPCVVKPVGSGSGRGVTANITNPRLLEHAVAEARRASKLLIIEAHQPGHDYRLMVVNGRLAMALRLDPPAVRGDGKKSIRTLVERLNAERAQDRSPGAPSQVPIDRSMTFALASQGLTLDSVADDGREVLLRTNANRSTGGTAANVIEEVHPTIRGWAELLAQAAGFATAGIDYITPDISMRPEEAGGAFLEINTTPGMARAILSGLVPAELVRAVIGSQPGRVPTCLLIAQGRQAEEVYDILATRSSPGAGIVMREKAQLGPHPLPDVDRPSDRISSLLRYPALESFCILRTPEELVDHGLPLDQIQTAVILDCDLDEAWVDLLMRHATVVRLTKLQEEALSFLNEATSSPLPL